MILVTCNTHKMRLSLHQFLPSIFPTASYVYRLLPLLQILSSRSASDLADYLEAFVLLGGSVYTRERKMTKQQSYI